MKCLRCGNCCRTIPCVPAQMRYGLDDKHRDCPELKHNNKGYFCDWIKRDDIMKGMMITGKCDYPTEALKAGKYYERRKLIKYGDTETFSEQRRAC